ncbi:phosphodiesterase [Geodermatophilus sp. DF01-2]|uniref:phosphodiesterase n=1 Tax=Geodermatophilus sp. DF01-2 TaxID=2559610 RepID=UPI001073B4A3|nr:phosphodiesterase [Geodermatophilus sp. DF01_2]TFV62192.1 phosphodiesterase [Geodermatophilus sp. DF01_2]
MSDLLATAGRAVAVPLGALARWRRGKPMHPRGVVLEAVLERSGGPAGWGVPWLAGAGEQEALVRLSRGAGLPAPLPDLLGLAVRLPGPQSPVDLLLSTSGRGRLTRWVPVLRRDAAATFTSIMGYRSAAGPVFLAALPGPASGPVTAEPGPVVAAARAGRLAYTLAAARGTGAWQPFGRLRLHGPVPGVDPDLRFDAVRNPPPDLVPDGPMARFRAPAYAAAREARDAREAAG